MKCDQCDKVCRSVPGLKRHKLSAHMEKKTINNEQSASSEENSAVHLPAPVSSSNKNTENNETSCWSWSIVVYSSNCKKNNKKEKQESRELGFHF